MVRVQNGGGFFILHIITIYYLELMIFTNVIVQLMTIVIKVRRQPCVTATDGRLYYNF